MSCRPLSSSLITIRLRARPFTSQLYRPTPLPRTMMVMQLRTSMNVQEILDHSLKNGTLVVLGDWNAKVREDALKNWKGTCGRYCNQRTNERGFCWGIHSANTKHPKDAPQGLSSISKSLKTLKFQSPSKQWLVEWLIGEALTLLDADDTN